MEHPSNIIVFSIFLGQNSRTMILWKYPEDKNAPTNRLLTNYTQKLFSYHKHKTWKLHSKCSIIMINESVMVYWFLVISFKLFQKSSHFQIIILYLVKGFLLIENIILVALKCELNVSSIFCQFTVHRNLWRVVAFWLTLCSCCNILAH